MKNNDSLLQKYIILKLLGKYNKITRYKLRKLFMKKGFSPSISSFYGILKELHKENLITYDLAGVWLRNDKEKLEIVLCELTDLGLKKINQYEDIIKRLLI